LKQGTSKLLLFISVAIVIAVVLLELTLAKIVRYTTTYSSGFDLTFFGSIVIPLIAFGYIIIICSRVITRDIIRKNTPNLQLLQRTVIISTVICSILLSYIWIEMFMYSKYTIIFVISVIGISYSTSSFVLALLAYRFLIWLRAYRNHVILSYVIASSLLSLTVALTMANVIYMLASQIPIISRNSAHILAYVVTNPYFEATFLYVSIISFMSIWLASLFLFREYYAQTKRYRYLLLSCVPLFYFLTQFQPFLIQLFAEYRLADPTAFGILYSLFISYSKPIGGIFFGLAFFVVAGKVRITPLKDYLVLAGLGLIFFFTTNQAIVLNNLTYPPFGVASSSLLGLASFLVFLGIYGSALSFAQDTSIRRQVRSSVSHELRLMDRIGMSEVQEQVSRRVSIITKNLTKEMEVETGIGTSLNEDEVQNYISEVIDELQEHKKLK
jgi:hypothetical protein